jgi:hypothetical protein
MKGEDDPRATVWIGITGVPLLVRVTTQTGVTGNARGELARDICVAREGVFANSDRWFGRGICSAGRSALANAETVGRAVTWTECLGPGSAGVCSRSVIRMMAIAAPAENKFSFVRQAFFIRASENPPL